MAAPTQVTLTSAQVAEICGGEAHTAASITQVSSPERAHKDSLVFAETPESLTEAVASQAGLILAPAGLAQAAASNSSDPRLILTSDPRLAFARCARALSPPRDAAQIHSTALIEPSARVGARARIGAGAVIEADAILGDDVVIGSRATIARGVRLGDRVIVQSGAVLGSTGFGYVRDAATGEYIPFPQQGDLVVEDDVEIGANTTIDRGALGETRIGRGTKIDNLVHVGHNCRIGRNVIIAAQVGISGSSVVEDGAILAGQVGISDHCRIGSGVILGGQAGVYRGKSVEGAGQVFAGTPAEPLQEHMRSLARLRRLK